MTWWDILVSLFFFVLLYVSFQLGAATEHWKQESREEAIRKIAYRDGCEWSLDFWRKHMNQTEFNSLYEGHFDTKESS